MVAAAAVTAVCIALVFHSIEIDTVAKTLRSIRSGYTAVATGLIGCSFLVALVRLRVVLGKFGYSPTWRRLFTSFSVGLLGNQFVFNIIGQSIGRAGALTSSGVPFGATIVATFFERTLAAVVCAIAGIAGAWLLLPHFGFNFAQGNSYHFSLIGGMILVALAAAMVSYRQGAAARVAATVGQGIERFWPVALLTILIQLLMLGAYIAVLLALGVEVFTLEVIGALAIIMFAASLPISIGGWGIRELSAVTVLGTIGLTSSTALSVALTIGVLSLGVLLVIAIPGLFLIPTHDRRVGPATEKESMNRLPNWNAGLAMGCGVLTAVFIFFQVRIQGENSILITANPTDFFALIGLGSLILLLAGSRYHRASLSRPFAGAVLLFSLLLAYGLLLGYANFGSNSWAALNRGFGYLVILGYAAVGLSVPLMGREEGRRTVLRIFVAAGAMIAASQAILLLVKCLGFSPPPEAFPYPLRGYGNNANAFAFHMTMTAIATIVAYRLGVLGTSRRWLIAVLVLTGVVIYFSGSRTGMVMFAMLLVLSVAFAPPPERRAALGTALHAAFGVGTLCVVLVALPSYITPVLSEISSALIPVPADSDIWIRTSPLHASSDSLRWRIFMDNWHLWLERPILGHGLGAYIESQLGNPLDDSKAYTEPYLVPHTVPIWLMAEMGIIGLAVGLASFGCLLLGAKRLMLSPDHQAWGAGLLMVLLCWGAALLVHDFVFQRSFWFFSGLAFGGLVRSGRLAGQVSNRGGGAVRGDACAINPAGGPGAMARRLMLVVTNDRYLWTHRIGLALAARDAGYDVTIVSHVSEYGERIRALGLNLIDVDFARGRLSPWAGLRTVRALCDIYRQVEPHLVHHVAIKPIVLGSMAAGRAQVPAVVNALAGLGTALTSSHPKARLMKPVLRPAIAWAMRRPSSHAVVQTAENATFVKSLGVPRERLSLMRGGAGVDVRVFRPRPEPEGPVRVTMVSRLLREKGVHEFVQAAARIRKTRKDIVFTLAGAPDEENPTSISQEQMRSWATDGLVEYWGYRNDVAEVLADSHIAVLPTYYGEGVPKALLEAAACGRPIIATDIPGCQDVVRHGRNGLLVPTRDARALADAIISLVDDPARRAEMGAEGRRRAEAEFDAERIHAEMLQVYERVLAAAESRGKAAPSRPELQAAPRSPASNR